MERELGKTDFRMFNAKEVCQPVLDNPPFSLDGRFENKEISVDTIEPKVISVTLPSKTKLTF